MTGAGTVFVGELDNGPRMTVYPGENSSNGPSFTVYPAGATRPSDFLVITPIFEDGQMARGTSYPALPEKGWREFILHTPSDSGVTPLHVMYSESTGNDPTQVVNHRYGNKTVVLPDGTAWNVPPGKSIADIPRVDPIGDRLDDLAGIARSNASAGDFSEAQRRAIANRYAAGQPWVADQLERKYLGSVVHGNLNDLLASDPTLSGVQSNAKGVDYTKPGSDISWELLSDTKSNLQLHATRPALRDEFVRYIKYRPK
jgi:hypothetical protein